VLEGKEDMAQIFGALEGEENRVYIYGVIEDEEDKAHIFCAQIEDGASPRGGGDVFEILDGLVRL
jgi:hypothetical protein